MHTTRPLLLLLALLASVAGGLPALAQSEQAQEAFFQGLDLAEAGDCPAAIPYFEQSLQLDPALHQARLYLAECLHAGGRDDEARAQLAIYLTTEFPGAEVDRAGALYTACGGDLDELFPPETGPDPGPPPVVHRWTPLTVEAGLGVDHHANRVGLTDAGPRVGVRVLPWRWLELSAGGGLGLAGYPDHDGTVYVPSLSAGVHFSAPLGPVRIVAGVRVPVLISRYTEAPRADAGVLGEVGLRVAVPDSRLVLGGRFHGGHAVSPWIGGGVQVGVQLGPLGSPP